MADEITVAVAAERIFGERTSRTIRAVQRLVARGANGPFPGAHPADPTLAKSTLLIPVSEVDAYKKILATKKTE